MLFDEIEKAHPDVFNIMLQILEDGILTDAQGRRVDFKNTILIMTSNVGASGLTTKARPLGFGTVGDAEVREEEKQRDAVMEALKATFKPEFLNRLDEIILFRKLDKPDIEKITKILLAEVEKRTDGLGIHITFTPEVVSYLADEGFDPVYGARPLRRAIVRRVEDPLSEEMLRGNVEKGDTVDAVLADGKIAFQKRADIPPVDVAEVANTAAQS